MRIIAEGFGLGLASILTNVCLLPLYPGMIAFLVGQGEAERSKWRSGWLGLVVLLGVFTMLLTIGLLFSLLAGLYTPLLPVVVLGSYGLVVVLGVLMLLGRNPFVRLATVEAPLLADPMRTAFVYGLLLAPMTLPCTGALLLGALGRVAGIPSLVGEITFLFAFCLGFGWPLILLPLATVSLQRRFIGWMTHNHTLIERAAGLMLLAFGVYGLVLDYPLFRELLPVS